MQKTCQNLTIIQSICLGKKHTDKANNCKDATMFTDKICLLLFILSSLKHCFCYCEKCKRGAHYSIHSIQKTFCFFSGMSLLAWVILKRKDKTVVNHIIRKKQIADGPPENPGMGAGRDLTIRSDLYCYLPGCLIPGSLTSCLHSEPLRTFKTILHTMCTHYFLAFS